MSVEPTFKENQGDCACGCGAWGVLMKNGHVRRKCLAAGQCVSCRNRNNKRGGHAKQRTARRALGVPDAKFVSALTHEEMWRGTVRVEVKSGKQVDPVMTRFLLSEKQSEQNRPVGDLRPFVAVFMPSGTSDGLVVFRTSSLEATVAALAEQLGLVA